MASSGNTNPNVIPNQQGGVVGGVSGVSSGVNFDMNKFFKPATLPPPPAAANPTSYAAAASAGASFAPSASFPPPSGPYSFPPQTPPYYHPQLGHQHMPNFPPPDHHLNLLPQRSVSFPVPPLQPVQNPTPNQNLNQNPNPNQNSNHGARLMAMLTPPPNFEYSNHPPTPMPTSLSASTGLQQSPSAEFLMPQTVGVPQMLPVPGPVRMPSSKLPRGRHLVGERMVYDVDARLPGEEQPQLEVTPITKYVSDPGLILGHQIAVNKTYICYGLKMGNIRALNINTALRSLLRGHTQRITDMAFFAEDVHLLASASIEGRVCVWKISEGPDDEGKPQIYGHVVLAIHITSDNESVHPRVCWHCHKQEILVVAIGKNIFRIDTLKLCKGADFSADEPLLCPVDKLVDGVQLVGKHEGEVTDLSMCQWMTTRLVSASKDGTIKIWEDRKALPLLELRPHGGQPVDAAKFLSSPHQLGHIILITAGPLNREVKLWASSGDEGWLLPSDAESWRCTQTLELNSSGDPRNEDVFFNQVVSLSQAGLLLLANAKKNAIYAIHLEYGANPAATHMDYLAEFTVTMPILSFTGTSDVLPHGEHQVQVYCVQTQAIQQYALDISQCLPPPIEKSGIEKSESGVSLDKVNLPPLDPSESKSMEATYSTPASSNEVSVPASSSETNCRELNTTYVDSTPTSLLSASSLTGISPVALPPLPLSPRLSRKTSDIRGDHAFADYPVDRQMDSPHTSSSSMLSLNDDNRATQGNSSDVNQPAMFKRPTHLVTPSELMPISTADTTRAMETGKKESKTQDEEMNNDSANVEVEIKVVGESGISRSGEPTRPIDHPILTERNEKSFYSQASDLGADMTRECYASPSQSTIMEEARSSIMEALSQPSHSGDEEDEVSNDVSPTPVFEGEKLKERNVQESAEISQGSVNGSSIQSFDTAFQQIIATAETVKEIMASMKEFQEMQKQMSANAAAPVIKEGRRLEGAVARCVEKATKANADALWARMQEEMAKHEKLIRDRTQQLSGNLMSKDVVPMLERLLKKELAAVGTNITRAIIPAIEKTVGSAITESFQRGVGDKAASQLEKSVTSKLEPAVARQIQLQFQTSGKQALQDGLKSCFEASIIPAFEVTCKAMFEQIDVAFQKGIVEHTQAAQHHIETTHSPLALALRDSLNSASSLTQSLSGELADGQRKLIALAAAGANSQSGNQLVTQLSNGPLAGLHEKVDQPFDPTKELSRLISEHKYEEAFTSALQRSDVAIVSWLCSQVDLQRMLTVMPLPLTQGVLLSLLQQLACDITKDTTRKLGWMLDVASCIIPHDPMIAVHARPILEQVYQILNHQRSLPNTTPAEISSLRVIMHVINSMLMAYK
ncbi:enhancer of mRNA-decapping protein 4-like [Silene latifolia]|uniref:enhancer of mRNA-decapping protein 4-like n=1 Tax=Silene latifolia TaxID=37657 RepID=UPI003D76EF89